MEEKIFVPKKDEGFFELIKEGMKRSGRTLSDEMRAFLFFRTRRLVTDAKERHLRRTLTDFEFMSRTKDASPAVVETLQDIGDSALFFSGFFPRRARARNVSVSFYMDVGRSAYHELSSIDRTWHWDKAADQFPALVDVLLAIPERSPLDRFAAADIAETSRMARAYLNIGNVVTMKQ